MQWYGSQPPYGPILEYSGSYTNTISLCLWSGPTTSLKLRNHPHYLIDFYCYIFKMCHLKVLFSSTLKTPWNISTTAVFVLCFMRNFLFGKGILRGSLIAKVWYMLVCWGGGAFSSWRAIDWTKINLRITAESSFIWSVFQRWGTLHFYFVNYLWLSEC